MMMYCVKEQILHSEKSNCYRCPSSMRTFVKLPAQPFDIWVWISLRHISVCTVEIVIYKHLCFKIVSAVWVYKMPGQI